MTSKNRIPSVTLKDLYKNLHKQELYKDLSFKDFKILSIKIFKDIISDIFNSKEVNLPHGMGKLFLVPYITKGNVIDYGLTRKFGKKIKSVETKDGFNVSYLFELGSIKTIKEAVSLFFQKHKDL